MEFSAGAGLAVAVNTNPLAHLPAIEIEVVGVDIVEVLLEDFLIFVLEFVLRGMGLGMRI
jgi:hypothetical protein